MRSSLVFHAVDSRTEGMPTGVITSGVGLIPGATMNDGRQHFIAHLDHIRRLLMNEPRGHSSMSGAKLQPPSRSDCDYGLVYIGHR
jgi:proline racemase